MKYWKKLGEKEIRQKIGQALEANVNFGESTCLGIPASSLDECLFGTTGSSPGGSLFQVYAQNPNHIGCHTLGDSEVFFHGTQALEKEVIELLAVDLLKAGIRSTDGYIASGGTEANLQALWIYRNYFVQHQGAGHHEIVILTSADTHYSVPKAANLLHIDCLSIPVDECSRTIIPGELESRVEQAMSAGKKYFVVVANMGTTMFGSVDHPGLYAAVLRANGLPFFIHVDAAFGGFVYPVSSPFNDCTFSNPDISSITLDAHKMLQAPYGTGIFIVRKGLMSCVLTREAAYINGFDITVSGSRSGANAVAVWMLLAQYGPNGWLEKINKLLYRTSWLCGQLDGLGIGYFNQDLMNIVAIDARFISPSLARQYGLVPDRHDREPGWYKIVIMDHVDLDVLGRFLEDLRSCCKAALASSH